MRAPAASSATTEQSAGSDGRRERVDDRDREVLRQRRPGVRAPAGDDEPVDAARQQRPHVVLLADRVARGSSHMKAAIWPAPSASSAPRMSGMLKRP